MGYGQWTPDYFHRSAIKLWRDFHPDKPCYGADFVEVGKRRYIRIFDVQGKMIGLYLAQSNGTLVGKKTWPLNIETAPAIYPKPS